ncbi:MAG: hypothetical protein ACI92E_001942 [Oceanicoccus sp.]|jgi:hypothetical protein
MIKALLYLSLFSAHGIAAGEVVLPADQTSLTLQLVSTDQVDEGKRLDSDDPDMSVGHPIQDSREKTPSIVGDKLATTYPKINSVSNFIRAPPFSS